MKSSLYLLLSLLLVVSSMNSYADNFEPLPYCYKPNKPLWLATGYYQARYKRDVEGYQRCMKAFIVTQERAVNVHTKAAQKALQTWNDFAKEQ